MINLISPEKFNIMHSILHKKIKTIYVFKKFKNILFILSAKIQNQILVTIRMNTEFGRNLWNIEFGSFKKLKPIKCAKIFGHSLRHFTTLERTGFQDASGRFFSVPFPHPLAQNKRNNVAVFSCTRTTWNVDFCLALPLGT